MPKRKRSSSFVASKKRKSYSRGTYRKKALNRSRIGRVPSTKVHHFSRWRALTSSDSITLLTGSSNVSKSFQFSLADLPNYTEFTSLFDQYKLWKIQIQFKLHSNPEHGEDVFPAVGGGLQYLPITYPTMYIFNDFDDSNTETLAQIRERSKAKRFVLKPNSIVKWNVRPAVLGSTYRTALTNGYKPMWNTFIDIAQPDVPHYATKLCIDYDGWTLPAVSGVAWGLIVVNVEMKYFFSCKDVR